MKFPSSGFNGVFQSLNPRTKTLFLDLEKTQQPYSAMQKLAELPVPLYAA